MRALAGLALILGYVGIILGLCLLVAAGVRR